MKPHWKSQTDLDYHYKISSLELLDLPDELLLIILEFLCIESHTTLWNVCRKFRSLLRTISIKSAKECVLPNTWRLKATLNFDYFTFIAPMIQVLNLNHFRVKDNEAMNVLRLMENLESLDARYTGLSLLELSRVCRDKPKLKTLAAEFNIPQSEDMRWCLRVCSRNFKHIVDLHLVGLTSYRIPNNGGDMFPFHMLFRCNSITRLKLTDVRINGLSLWRDIGNFYANNTGSPLKLLSVHTNSHLSKYSQPFNILPSISPEKWEAALVIFDRSNEPEIHATQKLFQAFRKLKIDIHCEELTNDFPILLSSDNSISFYMWHHCLATDNSDMYLDIMKEMHSKIPMTICRKNATITNADSCYLSTCTWKSVGIPAKRTAYGLNKTVIHQEVDLNIHEFVHSDKNINVTYKHINCDCFKESVCYTVIKTNVPVLKNIVEFSLLDIPVSVRFYELLLKYCVRLETLHIYAQNRDVKYSAALGKLNTSRSLKNFYLVTASSIDLASVLRALTPCPSIKEAVICNVDPLHRDFDVKKPINERLLTRFLKECNSFQKLHIIVLKEVFPRIHNQDVYEYYEQFVESFNKIKKELRKEVSLCYDDSKFEWVHDIFPNDSLFHSLFGNVKFHNLNVNQELVSNIMKG